MGCNYYAVSKTPSVINQPIHIGKSSKGWLFHFQEQYNPDGDPPVVWNNYTQLKEWLQKYVVEKQQYVILDEYDTLISYEELIKLIDEKQNNPENLSNPDNFLYCKNVDGYRFSSLYFC